MDFTSKCHLDTYATISPSRTELSQVGRTILITGGGSGIGYAIAKSFTKAGAVRLILLGRRESQLAIAKGELEKIRVDGFEVLIFPCDVSNADAVRHMWGSLNSKGVIVDVLVLNAAAAFTTPNGLAEQDFVSKVWATFETNAFSALLMTDIFLRQGSGTKNKAIICLGSGSVHISPVRASQLGYASSKTALLSLMQGVADMVDPNETQIISYNPGSVRTESVLKSNIADLPLAWNTEALAGDFAMWAASNDARFLHGRFVWCNWDVDELRAKKEFAHPGFCRIGLQGLAMLSGLDLYDQMGKKRQESELGRSN